MAVASPRAGQVQDGNRFPSQRVQVVMRVVATTGMPGAGKGLAVEVAQELGFDIVRMGDLVREEAERRGLEPVPESFGQVASDLREAEGPEAWARRTVERIQEIGDERILVDGVRNLEELDVLREALGDDLLVVAILASPSTRYERMMKRGRAEDTTDLATLEERDRRELGYGLGDVIAMADIYIDNEGDPEEAQATLRAVLGAGA